MQQSQDPGRSLGWQSQRFCLYPQEIILQFPNMVNVKQMQFLMHESKIPSKIEIFAYSPGM
jgi:centrosomal protein CEP104